MGYDMSIVGEMPEAERIAKEALDAEWNAALDKRDAIAPGVDWATKREIPEYAAAQEVVLEVSDRQSAADTHYFRLNIWGMSRARMAMFTAGMIYEAPCPEFPTYDPPTSAEGGSEALVAAEDAYTEEYDRLSDAVRSVHPEGGTTIPDFKFHSNDGWLVTEQECAAAVAAWREHKAKLDAEGALAVMDEDGAQDDDAPDATFAAQWWPEWIAFLERASQRGGFKVW